MGEVSRLIGGSAAIAAGVAMLAAELAFMPWLTAHMTEYTSTKQGVSGMFFAAAIALLLIAIGLSVIFGRPRNSN